MKIFNDYRQAIAFAFALAAHPGEAGASRNSMIRIALNDAGANTAGALLDAATLAMLDSYAERICEAIERALPSAMRAALTAHYSLDWETKRTATTWLQGHIRPQLAHIIDHPALADRMVSRHYIAQRERGPGWTLESIGVEFRVAATRLDSAARMLDLIDGALLDDAVTLLQHSLPLPTLEATHA